MINIAIVDDDNETAEQISKYLDRYKTENGEDIRVSVFDDGDTLMQKYHSQFDIVLMDVEMKFLDGMTAAEEIRKTDKEVVIIFITNMPQYAIRGYAVEALDYILKPVSYFAFSQCIGRAIARMKNRAEQSVVVNFKGGAVRLDVMDIIYIESRGHSIIYHTHGGAYEVYSTMKETEEKMAKLHFFRASKWYIINLAHVDSLQDGSVKLAGTHLTVSRARRKELMEALTLYWGEVIK